jgi:drug/metabolite transporter (DMT)-like permease
MVASMASFAVEDVFVKKAASVLPVGQVMIYFGLGGMLIFAAMAILKGDRLLNPDVRSRSMLVRGVFEVVGRLFYVLAIALTPLSSATAILQATPIVVIASAAVFFGERVGVRRWGAVIVGLVGVLVILRPGADSFSVYYLLAVIGMLGLAGRDLASRAAPAHLGTNILGFYGFLAVVIAGAVYSLWEGADCVSPTWSALSLILFALVWGVFAYIALMNAMRIGEVSFVTPFRYSRLLFGLFFGIVFFGETLDLPTLVGSGLVVASGLYILMRTNRATA